jgi:hypothetical protein
LDQNGGPTFELQPDDLEQVAGAIGADRKNPWRVGVGFEIDIHDRVLERVADGAVIDAVLARRSVDLHTRLS